MGSWDCMPGLAVALLLPGTVSSIHPSRNLPASYCVPCPPGLPGLSRSVSHMLTEGNGQCASISYDLCRFLTDHLSRAPALLRSCAPARASSCAYAYGRLPWLDGWMTSDRPGCRYVAHTARRMPARGDRPGGDWLGGFEPPQIGPKRLEKAVFGMPLERAVSHAKPRKSIQSVRTLKIDLRVLGSKNPIIGRSRLVLSDSP
jgi:hypothetical protein